MSVIIRKKEQLNSWDETLDIDQWIGLWENLQESPIFHGKTYGFL